MIDNIKFMTFEHFLTWFESLNKNEPVDIIEAKEIYFNLENYEECL